MFLFLSFSSAALFVFLTNTNMDSEKGFAFFQRFLREQGIIKELENMGIEDGDTAVSYTHLANIIFHLMLNVCIKHSVYFITNHYYAISVILYLYKTQ